MARPELKGNRRRPIFPRDLSGILEDFSWLRRRFQFQPASLNESALEQRLDALVEFLK
jgi:hypothetical protein